MKIYRNSAVVAMIVSFVFGLALPVSTFAAGPARINLKSAGNFAILSSAALTDTESHTSNITGNVGASPISGTAIGVVCAEVIGTIYSVDPAGPIPCRVTNTKLLATATKDMGSAYAVAVGMSSPKTIDLGKGNIGGLTLAPGLYKWSTDVNIPANVTLSGGANDVWIFQIKGNLDIATTKQVVLDGGAQAKNIFWQVGGGAGATLGTYSTFNGTILSATQVVIQTGAVLNGRALAQTQVTLDQSTVVIPVSATPVQPPQPPTVGVKQCKADAVSVRNATNKTTQDTFVITNKTLLQTRNADFKTATNKRDADVKSAIKTRNAAEQSAKSITDKTARNAAISDARKTYQSTIKSAQDTFQATRKTVQSVYSDSLVTARKTYTDAKKITQDVYVKTIKSCQV